MTNIVSFAFDWSYFWTSQRICTLLNIRALGYLDSVSFELKYVSLVVVDVDSLGNWALETISVQEDVSVLSGAWVFSGTEREPIQSILEGRLILALGADATAAIQSLDFKCAVDIDAFLTEARSSSEATRLAFYSYIAENPKKRSKLVEPTLTNWPETFILADANKVLDSMGKQVFPENTPHNFRRTLAASNLLKILIDCWLSDERERLTRSYLNSNPPFIRLLPKAWTLHLAGGTAN